MYYPPKSKTFLTNNQSLTQDLRDQRKLQKPALQYVDRFCLCVIFAVNYLAAVTTLGRQS